jgi:hypothetical protein
MKRLLVVIAVLSLATSAYAFGTWPGSYTYDGLIMKDRAGLPLTPSALHLNGGFFWRGLLGKSFDNNGDSQDDVSNENYLGLPAVDLGYAIDEKWEVALTFQLLYGPLGDYSEFGIGDMWFKARGLWQTGTDFYFGPRVAVKIPVGDDEKGLGDGQLDIDIGAVGAKYGETHFRLNGQLGFRYRLKRTYTVAGVEYETKPGIMIYSLMEPGFGIGHANKFSFYFPIAFDYHAESSTNDVGNNDSGYTFGFGVKPAYALDQNNTLNLMFLFPLFGKAANQELYIGFTADSFIPM